MDQEETGIQDRFGTRKKISGHWGGNYAIEKLYGKSSEQRKNRIVDYVFEGYEPREDKDFYEKSEQTDITTIPKVKQHIRQYGHIHTPIEIETPIEQASPKKEATINESSKLFYSEIMMSYENKSLNVNVLHLQNKRVLNIPIKDLKQHCLRIRFSPPYIKIYLGKHLIFPFDLGRILSSRVKCSDEEKWKEATQRMPEITTLKADKDSKILGELPLVYLHSSLDKDYEENTDFIFKDKYNYLPPSMTKCYNRRRIHLGKPLYRDTNKIKCLQRNLAHINEPEKFVTESQMSFKKLPSPLVERLNVVERFKNFIFGPIMDEGTTNTIVDSQDVKDSDEEIELICDHGREVEYKFHNKVVRDSITLATGNSKSKLTRRIDTKSPEKSKSTSDPPPRPKPQGIPYRYDQTKGVPIIVPIKTEEKNTPKSVLTPIDKVRIREEKRLEIEDFEKAFVESDIAMHKQLSAKAMKSNLKTKGSPMVLQSVTPEAGQPGIIRKHSKNKETAKRLSQGKEGSYISDEREKSTEQSRSTEQSTSILKDKKRDSPKEIKKKGKTIEFFGSNKNQDKDESESTSDIVDKIKPKKSKRKRKDHIFANLSILEENKDELKDPLNSHNIYHQNSSKKVTGNSSYESVQNKHYSKKTEDKKTKNPPYSKEKSSDTDHSTISSTDKQIELDFDSSSNESNLTIERFTLNTGFGKNLDSDCSESSSHYSYNSCHEYFELDDINPDYAQNYLGSSCKLNSLSPYLNTSDKNEKNKNNEAGTDQFKLKENEFLSKDKDKK